MQFIFSLQPEEAGAQPSKAFLMAIQMSKYVAKITIFRKIFTA
jgi:hypothetical protein